jgi:hypothetical protein
MSAEERVATGHLEQDPGQKVERELEEPSTREASARTAESVFLEQTLGQAKEVLRSYTAVRRYESYADSRKKSEEQAVPSSVAEIDAEREQLLSEAPVLVLSIEQSISLIKEKVAQLAPGSASRNQALNAVAPDIQLLIGTIVQSKQKLELITPRLSLLTEARQQLRLQAAGYASRDEVAAQREAASATIADRHAARRALERRPLKERLRLRSHAKDRRAAEEHIIAAQQEREQLDRLFSLDYPDVPKVSHETFGELSEPLAEFAQSVLDQLGTNLEAEAAGLPSFGEVIPLKSEAIPAIVDTLTEQQAGPELKEYPQDFQDEVRAILLEVAQHRTANHSNIPWQATPEEQEQMRLEDNRAELLRDKIRNVKEKGLSLVPSPDRVEGLLSSCLYRSEPMAQEFERWHELVQHLPAAQAEQEYREKYARAIGDLDSLLRQSNLQSPDAYQRLQDLERWLKPTPQTREFKESLGKERLQSWKALKATAMAYEGVEKERFDALDQHLTEVTIDGVLKSKQHTDESVRLGYRLLGLEGPQAVLVNLLNAYRESGTSGEYPFSGDGRHPRDTHIVSYLRPLSSEVKDAIAGLGIPHLSETLESIEKAALSDPPIRLSQLEEVRTGVIPILLHCLNTDRERYSYFVIQTVNQLKYWADVSDFYPYLPDLVSQDSLVRQEVIEVAIDGMRKHPELIDPALHNAIVWDCVDSGKLAWLMENWELFSGAAMTRNDIAQRLVVQGNAELVLKNLDHFPKLTEVVSHNDLVIALSGKGWETLLGCFERLTELTLTNDEIFQLFRAEYWLHTVGDTLLKLPALSVASLVKLPLSASRLKEYIQHHPQPTEGHRRLLQACEKTYLNADQLPSNALEGDQDFEEIARFGLDGLREAAPLAALRERGFTPIQLLRYATREKLSYHDAYLMGDQLAALYDQSGLTPPQFCEQVLYQVLKDDATYESGTAHHHLNTLANQGILPLEKLRRDVAQYPAEVQNEIAPLLEAYPTQADVFVSWRTLRIYAQKAALITSQYETLVTLANLRSEGKEELAEWYRIVAAGSVDSNALAQFLTQPKAFFNRDSSHTARERHNNKKPSNYIEIPHLDLTAEELRDALIEGAIDRIAAVPPMEIEYEVAPKGSVLASELAALPRQEKARLLLGSKRQGIEGLAQDEKGLFHSLSQILKRGAPQFTIQEFLATPGIPLSEESIREIDTILAGAKLKQHKVVSRGEKYIVAVHPKSSPHGVLAGNDTACCMPFGDGKAVLYMLNPACAQFTIQKEKGDGTRRTLIQSVMTLNAPMPGHTVPELMEKLDGKTTDLAEVLPEDSLLTARERILVGDNAEANPNFKESVEAGELSTLLYGDFFQRYLARFAERRDIKSDEIQIGMGYSDVFHDLETVPNETIPVAPLSYSDNMGPEAYKLVPAAGPLSRMKAEESTAASQPAEPLSLKVGVSPLTYADTLATAYMESKAYQGVPSLLSGLHDMENGLIAKDINNAHKGRPELSFKSISRDQRFEAYLFAYQGKWDDGTDCLYVADFASKGSQTGAAFVLREFCRTYKEHYLDTGQLLPLYAEMRESTSYQLLLDHRALLERWLGVPLKWEELNVIQDAGKDERRHVVRLSVAS